MLQAQSTQIQFAFSDFLLECQARRYTPATQEFYRERLGAFITWTQQSGHQELCEITQHVLRVYFTSLQDRSLKPHTIHGAARAVRAFLNFCQQEELITKSPKVTMPRLPRQPLPAFEPEDVRRLLSACENERDRCLVMLLLDTGLRLAEAIALNGGDIDDATGTVQVRSGKGEKSRTVYLGARTQRELARYWRKCGRPASHTPVWVNAHTGARLTRSGLRQVLERIGERAKVEHCHPHTFRRTFALWCLRSGMSIFHLQRLMGHEDITVLRPYLALLQDDIQAAHRDAAPVDRYVK